MNRPLLSFLPNSNVHRKAVTMIKQITILPTKLQSQCTKIWRKAVCSYFSQILCSCSTTSRNECNVWDLPQALSWMQSSPTFISTPIRYLDVIGSCFMLSSFYRLDLHNKTTKLLLHQQIYKNQIENRTSPNLVMVIGSACFVIS